MIGQGTEESMAQLCFALLGSQEVRFGDTVLSFSTRKARRSFERLLAYAQEAQELSAIGEAHNLALLLIQQPKGLQMAQKHLDEALRSAQISGEHSMMAETSWNQALVAMSIRDRASVETHVQDALEFARVHGVKEKMIRCLLYLGMNALYTGAYAQSLTYAQEAFAYCDAMEREATPIAEMQVEVPPLWSYLGLPPHSWRHHDQQSCSVFSCSCCARFSLEIHRPEKRRDEPLSLRAWRRMINGRRSIAWDISPAFCSK